MPSMSWDDEHPFDPRSTPCIEEMGVVADTFWRQPGVLRSDSPHSFAAAGPRRRASPPRTRSRSLTASTARWGASTGRAGAAARHQPPIRHHHPHGRLLAGCATAAPKSVLVRQGEQIARVDYGETTAELLPRGWLAGREGLQRRGVVVMPRRARCSRDIVETLVERLRAEETIFLHPYGVDEECDEARASIPF